MLEKIAKAKVFNAYFSADKRVLELTEGCDNYFSITLTKKELKELISDFQILENEMKE